MTFRASPPIGGIVYSIFIAYNDLVFSIPLYKKMTLTQNQVDALVEVSGKRFFVTAEGMYNSVQVPDTEIWVGWDEPVPLVDWEAYLDRLDQLEDKPPLDLLAHKIYALQVNLDLSETQTLWILVDYLTGRKLKLATDEQCNLITNLLKKK
jgi:hypothetical protein